MFFAVLILILLTSVVSAETITVTRVVDGDTLVSQDGRRFRLWGVDAPELDQPYGAQAKLELETLLLGRQCDVIASRPGAWGRTDAVLAWRGLEVQAWLLRRGAVWVEPRYSTPEQRSRWTPVQDIARKGPSGLHSERDAVHPWLWRSGARNATAGQPGALNAIHTNQAQVAVPRISRRRMR